MAGGGGVQICDHGSEISDKCVRKNKHTYTHKHTLTFISLAQCHSAPQLNFLGQHDILQAILLLKSCIPLNSTHLVRAQFASVANVTYPETYERFLKAVNMMNLDVEWMASAGCLWTNVDFHDRLLVSTMVPLAVLVLLAAVYETTRAKSDELMLKIRNTIVSSTLLLTFLVYSSVSSTVFRMFACDNLDDGKSYLRADYRILCTDQKHRVFQAYAAVMIGVFPVGIPVFYGALLYHLRGLSAIDGSISWRDHPSARPTADLWAPYRPECFYYEVVECIRRIMLTGVVVFIYPGDAAQIVVTIVIAFAFFAISEALSPYDNASDKWLSRAGHIVVFFSFFAALLYKVDISNEREASQEVFAGVIVAVHVCLVIVVLGQSTIVWTSQVRVNEGDKLPRPRHGRTIADHNHESGVELHEAAATPVYHR